MRLLHSLCMFSSLLEHRVALIPCPSALGILWKPLRCFSFRCLTHSAHAPCLFSCSFPAQVFTFYSKVNFLILAFYPFTDFHFPFVLKYHALIFKSFLPLNVPLHSILFLLHLCFLSYVKVFFVSFSYESSLNSQLLFVVSGLCLSIDNSRLSMRD